MIDRGHGRNRHTNDCSRESERGAERRSTRCTAKLEERGGEADVALVHQHLPLQPPSVSRHGGQRHRRQNLLLARRPRVSAALRKGESRSRSAVAFALLPCAAETNLQVLSNPPLIPSSPATFPLRAAPVLKQWRLCFFCCWLRCWRWGLLLPCAHHCVGEQACCA